MRSSFTNWLRIAALLPKIGSVAFHGTAICPECGDHQLDFLYVADPGSRIGYLLVWCPVCHVGIRVSRVAVPTGFQSVTFEAVEQGKIELPKFVEVQPAGSEI